MTRAIWKYPLTEYELSMPIGAQILDIREQNGTGCLWALVNPDAEKDVRRFLVYGTGHSIKDAERMTYRGTFHIDDGALVFHVFEETTDAFG